MRQCTGNIAQGVEEEEEEEVVVAVVASVLAVSFASSRRSVEGEVLSMRRHSWSTLPLYSPTYSTSAHPR